MMRCRIYDLVLAVVCVFLVQGGGNLFVTGRTKVVISGAGSKVGQLVFKKLLAKKGFYPIGLVRDQSAFQKLTEMGAEPEQIKFCDIRYKEQIKGVFEGAQKAVLCTAAKPRTTLSYSTKNFFRKLIGKGRPPRPSELYYKPDETPYIVDYLSQKLVIDECVRSGIEHIVMLSNMGGYSRGVSSTDAQGSLLKWKRAAERYLIKRNFFTIIHTGNFTSDPTGGHREIVWDVDDNLLRSKYKTISRDDAAEVIVQSLIWNEAIGRSIDVGTLPVSTSASSSTSHSGPGKTDWIRFWARPGTNTYPSDD